MKHLRHFVCFKYKNNISEGKIIEIEKAFIKLEKERRGGEGVRATAAASRILPGWPFLEFPSIA